MKYKVLNNGLVVKYFTNNVDVTNYCTKATCHRGREYYVLIQDKKAKSGYVPYARYKSGELIAFDD